MRFCFAVLWAAVSISLVQAADPAPTKINPPDHAIVSGFDRFYHDPKSNAVDGGLLLLGELNCTSCHAVPAGSETLIGKKQAPYLGEVAFRADPKFLQRFITDTHATKPGSTMPSMLSHLPAAEAEQTAAALTHYLVSLSKEPFQRFAPDTAAVTRGEELFHNVGCVACHAPRQTRAPSSNALLSEEEAERPLEDLNSTSIPLSRKLHDKYSLPGLIGFLSNPLHIRPSGRMPNLNLTPNEVNDIAQYLLKDTQAPAPLNLEVFEGGWDRLPDFSKLKPKTTGTASGFNISAWQGRDNFALRFTGFIRLTKSGTYSFWTVSDDGSRITIDDTIVINHDGIHGATEAKGNIKLDAGLHRITVEYFEGAGGEELAVTWQGPGFERQPIPNTVLTSTDKPVAGDEAWKLDVTLAKRGEELFKSIGCASCHQLGAGNKQSPKSELTGKPLSELATNGGCLSNQPAAKRPVYQLNARMSEALTAAIQSLKSGQLPKRDSAATVHQQFVTMNCYTCHKRGDLGGVSRERDPYFTANQPDLGDEGRIPPWLTGVGDKLLPKALDNVLYKAAVARPYVNTRMPQFGEANLGKLSQQLIEVDLQSKTVPDVTLDKKEALKNGQKLVGKEALTCVSCHMFNRNRSLGIQAMDLTIMHERLRPEWFHRYMSNPSALRPGTRMPQAFVDGKSTYKNIYDGQADKQLTAIWTYLSEGRKAKFPDGVVPQGMELIVAGEAVMYRNFIKDAGPRAIGVGYPEDVNLAFDANQQRLALLWQGKFMDGSLHWEGRGQGYQGPLGDKTIKLPEGATWAILPAADASWPKPVDKNTVDPAFKFLGYQLDDVRRPTFSYELKQQPQGITITDFPRGLADDTTRKLVRTWTATSKAAAPQLYLRLAVGKIEKVTAGYRVGDQYTLIVPASANATIRGTGDQQELLVPFALTGGTPRELTVEYLW